MKNVNGTALTSAKEIPVGSFLVEHFCNSIAFYKVLSTTNKTLKIMRVWDEQTHFENAGGPVGYRYCKPTDRPYDGEYTKVLKKVCMPLRNGGFYIPGPISGSGMNMYDPNSEYCEWYE